jgi:hypothetical protein
MSNVYKTVRGANVDMNRLKLTNETVIAVGNAGVNARGDQVRGNRIVKSREQIAQENYNISGNNIAKNAVIRDSENDIIPDDVPSYTPDVNRIVDTISQKQQEPTNIEQNALSDAPRGGLANAVSRSQELAEKLAAQRRRI